MRMRRRFVGWHSAAGNAGRRVSPLDSVRRWARRPCSRGKPRRYAWIYAAAANDGAVVVLLIRSQAGGRVAPVHCNTLVHRRHMGACRRPAAALRRAGGTVLPQRRLTPPVAHIRLALVSSLVSFRSLSSFLFLSYMVSLSLSLSLALSLSVCLSLYLCFCLWLCLSPSLSFSLPVSVSISLPSLSRRAPRSAQVRPAGAAAGGARRERPAAARCRCSRGGVRHAALRCLRARQARVRGSAPRARVTRQVPRNALPRTHPAAGRVGGLSLGPRGLPVPAARCMRRTYHVSLGNRCATDMNNARPHRCETWCHVN